MDVENNVWILRRKDGKWENWKLEADTHTIDTMYKIDN